jgi:hypothetical protein
MSHSMQSVRDGNEKDSVKERRNIRDARIITETEIQEASSKVLSFEEKSMCRNALS